MSAHEHCTRLLAALKAEGASENLVAQCRQILEKLNPPEWVEVKWSTAQSDAEDRHRPPPPDLSLGSQTSTNWAEWHSA